MVRGNYPLLALLTVSCLPITPLLSSVLDCWIDFVAYNKNKLWCANRSLALQSWDWMFPILRGVQLLWPQKGQLAVPWICTLSVSRYSNLYSNVCIILSGELWGFLGLSWMFCPLRFVVIKLHMLRVTFKVCVPTVATSASSNVFLLSQYNLQPWPWWPSSQLLLRLFLRTLP